MSTEVKTLDDGSELTPDAIPDTAIALVKPPNDAQQGRVVSISKALDAAYQRASTLILTPEESTTLRQDFPDEAVRGGANGKLGLLYIEHAYTRERLHDVFGPGQWAQICRRLWTEEYKTSTNKDAVRVYADCVLLVRGCLVGEAVGAMSYFPSNAEQNYSDAIEGAQSEALRRIAGKYLGIGLQVWKKAFCEGWKQRHPKGYVEVVFAEPTPAAMLDDDDADKIMSALKDKIGDASGAVSDQRQKDFLAFVSQVCGLTVTHLSEMPRSKLAEVLGAIAKWTPKPGSPAALRKNGGAK